jgi:hypothetical protein
LAGNLCLNIGSGVGQNDNESVTIFSTSAAFMNPRMIPNTAIFLVDIVDMLSLNVQQPMYSYVEIGGESFGNTQNLRPNPVCNDMNSYSSTPPQPLLWPQVPVNFDTGAFLGYYLNVVNSQGNYNFSTTDYYGPKVRQVIGDIRACPTCLVYNIYVPPGNLTVVYQVSIDLNLAVNNCSNNTIDPTVTIGYSGLQYLIPISIARRTTFDGGISDSWFETTQNFWVNMQTTGTITLSATSQYQPQVFIHESVFVNTGCAVGQQRLRITYQMDFHNVYDTNTQVGVFNLTDFVYYYVGLPSNITNAYGDALYSFTLPSCNYFLNMCSQYVTMQSLCRVVAADGYAFYYGNRANAADRIAYMGSNIPFPTSLDGVHTFFYYTRQYTISTQTYALAVQSPAGYPDLVAVTFVATVYPDFTTQIQYDLQAGLLDVPTGTNITVGGDFELLVSIVNGTLVSSTTDRYNAQLRWSDELTVFIRATNVNVLQTVQLQITNVTFVGLNALGYIEPAYAGQSLNWTSIARYADYVDKYGQTIAPCTTGPPCSLLPLVVSYPGCDGFAIKSTALRSLLPANGYQITISYRFVYPLSGPGSRRRRLLSEGEFDGQTNMIILYETDNGTCEISNSTLIVNEDLASIGPTADSASSTLPVVAGGSVAAFALAYGIGIFVL